MDPPRLIVADLAKDQPYHFRLSVANLAGFGAPVLAQPSPSTITCKPVDTFVPLRFFVNPRIKLACLTCFKLGET